MGVEGGGGGGTSDDQMRCTPQYSITRLLPMGRHHSTLPIYLVCAADCFQFTIFISPSPPPPNTQTNTPPQHTTIHRNTPSVCRGRDSLVSLKSRIVRMSPRTCFSPTFSRSTQPSDLPFRLPNANTRDNIAVSSLYGMKRYKERSAFQAKETVSQITKHCP